MEELRAAVADAAAYCAARGVSLADAQAQPGDSVARLQGLADATPELYHRKCSAVFGHVYESYGGAGPSA